MPWGTGKEEIVRHVNELITQLKNKTYQSPFKNDFAEIYIENSKNSEAIPQGVPVPRYSPDKKRKRFLEMRRLAQMSQPAGYRNGSRDRLQTVLFYKQAKFMEDFEDNYEGSAPFSMYFPNYQMMSYEQLRTYFTWRSKVRKGVIRRTSFSYVFLYIYELINHIGIQNCEDGLDKLTLLWKEYRGYEKKLDGYMNEWIRDYYITNDFSEPFPEFLQKTGILQDLSKPPKAESIFDFYFPYSDYKIEKSIFFTPETAKTIGACFDSVIKTLDEFLLGQGEKFENLIFYSKSSAWAPFSNALYCSLSMETKNKVVEISNTEKYEYKNGCWTSSVNRIPKENGRLLIGYILKRIEQFYRRVTKYKYRVTANRNKIDSAEITRLVQDPQRFFQQIDAAIVKYYRQSQRKVITVDPGRIETIRENAQKTQEKLLIDGEETDSATAPMAPEPKPAHPAASEPAGGPKNPWRAFARSLDRTERAAVRMILENAPLQKLQAFSKDHGTMLEVLVDGINQKAIDTVNDNVMELSDKIELFDEYRGDLKRVISIEFQ